MLLTAEEARKELGLKSVQTIYRWAKRGWIRKITLGTRTVRFDSEEINDITKNGLNISDSISLRTSSPRTRRRRKRLWEK